MTPQFKAEVIGWLNAYGFVACVAFVAAACLCAARRPRGPRR